MSTVQARVRQKLTEAHNRQWLRTELARRRRAVAMAKRQRRDEVVRLARDGFRVVALPSLNDAFDELKPPCL